MVLSLTTEIKSLAERLTAMEEDPSAPLERKVPPTPLPSNATPETEKGPAFLHRQHQPETETTGAIPASKPAHSSSWAIDVSHSNFEWLLGGNWLARIGVVALIVGIAFFISLSIDRGWLSETGQITLGVLAGVAFLGAGEYFRNRYVPWAQAMAGGGLAIFYLSIYAGFALYDLFSPLAALGLFGLITLAGVIQSLRHESIALAVLAIFSGFATPLLLQDPLPDKLLLLAYVLVLDVGVLALASFRTWRWLTFPAWIASLIVLTFWVDQLNPSTGLQQVAISAVFLLFMGSTIAFHVVQRKPAGVVDLLLLVGNGLAYLAISYDVMYDIYRPWMGGFTALLAVFYVLLTIAFRFRPSTAPLPIEAQSGPTFLPKKGATSSIPLVTFTAAFAVLLAALAVPTQVGGIWVTMLWGLEALVLIWLSFAFSFPELRWSAYLLLTTMVVWLGAIQTSNFDLETIRPVINLRFLVFGVGVGSLYSALLMVRRRTGLLSFELNKHEEQRASIALFGLANLTTLWILSAEVLASADSAFFDLSTYASENVSVLGLTLLWSIYGAALMVGGIFLQSRWVRLGGLALLSISVIKLFVYDSQALAQTYRVIAFLGLGAILTAGGFLYQRHSKTIRGFLFE